jgi:hypothetical protein
MEKQNPADIAKAAMDKINAEKEAKTKLNLDDKNKPETKGAGAESSPDKAKTEVEKKAAIEQAEAQAKHDEEILSKKEEDLSEEDKARKAEITKGKPKEEINEDKVIKRKQEIQSEIDKLISEKKSLEEVKRQSEEMKDEISKMQEEIDNLKKEKGQIAADKNIPEETKLLKQKEAERLSKYQEEDKELSREERREMPKEDLENWLLEDMVAAQEWMTERSLRRTRERHLDNNAQKREKFISEIGKKQDESNARVMVKHPELNTNAREAELKAEGKSNKEIHETLLKENEKYRISIEIIKEDPDKYLTKENGPELVAAEIEKRLKNKSSESSESSEVDKLRREIEEKNAEIARLERIDESGGSSRPGEKKKEGKKTDFEIEQEKLAKRAGISPERLKAMKERRAKIDGNI